MHCVLEYIWSTDQKSSCIIKMSWVMFHFFTTFFTTFGLHLDIFFFLNKLFSCKFLYQFVNGAKNKKQTKKNIFLYALGECLIH